MITLFAIIVFVLFLKVVGFIFSAGFRILGWLLSGAGFIISILLAVTVLGFKRPAALRRQVFFSVIDGIDCLAYNSYQHVLNRQLWDIRSVD